MNVSQHRLGLEQAMPPPPPSTSTARQRGKRARHPAAAAVAKSSTGTSKPSHPTLTLIPWTATSAVAVVVGVLWLTFGSPTDNTRTTGQEDTRDGAQTSSGPTTTAAERAPKSSVETANKNFAKAAAAELEAKPKTADYVGCLEEMRLDAEHREAKIYWPGFHLACIENPGAVVGESVDLLLKNGQDKLGVDLQSKYGITGLIADLRARLSSGVYREEKDDTVKPSKLLWKPHAWKIYSSKGWEITRLAQLKTATGIYIFEGGAFLWPGIKLGYERNITIHDRSLKVTTLSLRPLAIRLSGFLSDGESKYVMKTAKAALRRSSVVSMDSDDGKGYQARTSENTVLTRGGSKTILSLEQRAHQLTRLPYDLGEEIQVVRYEPHQKYDAHRDFFHPNDYLQQPSILDWVDCGARNRIATVFWYLNTVEGNGGETYFPRALNENGTEYKPWNYDWKDCYRGTYVKPIQGDAILFYSMLPNGELDERSLHGGCPPEQETKWGANQWIWNKLDGPNQNCKIAPPGTKVSCQDYDDQCKKWSRDGDCDQSSSKGSTMRSLCQKSCKVCT